MTASTEDTGSPTAAEIAAEFVAPEDRRTLELAILRHMEHHMQRAALAEREACAKFVEATYLQDDNHEEAFRARFVVPEAASGYLEAWHQPHDVAAALRNRPELSAKLSPDRVKNG